MELVMVEHTFDPPFSHERLPEYGEKVGPCLAARSSRWVGSYWSTDWARCICVFEAPDAQSIRDALGMAGVPFVGVWTVTHHHP